MKTLTLMLGLMLSTAAHADRSQGSAMPLKISPSDTP